MRTIFAVASAAVLFCGQEVFAQTQGSSTSLTGPQIMARCQWTYDHLQSYQAAISVHLKPDYKHPQFNPPPGSPDPVAKAQLRYTRPGKVIVSGFSYLNPKKPTYFRLLCRGKYSWASFDTKPVILTGRDKDKQDQNHAVFAIFIPSFGTATSLPSVFLHLDWGWPVGLHKPNSVDNTVITAMVAGQQCYGVSARNVIPERYWIDQKTFLLVQIEDNDMQETFTETRVNPSIAAGSFRSPK